MDGSDGGEAKSGAAPQGRERETGLLHGGDARA